jgi:hypothetical protein
MDYRSYIKRIEFALAKIKAGEKIQEIPWQEVVVRELNEISKDCAKELQTETGQIGNKGDYQLGLDEWPPTRILSSTFICMGRLDNAREAWIKRGTAILNKGLSPNDTRSFWLWSAFIGP